MWGILLEQDTIIDLQRQAQSWLQEYLLLPYLRQPHVTLTACGFWLPEVSLEQDDNFSNLQQHLQLLDQVDLSAFELRMGGISSFTTVPFFEVIDAEGMLAKLRDALPSYFETIRQVPYCPHVTIGCYNNEWPTQAIAKRIQAFPPFEPITIKVEQIALLSYSTKDIGSPLEIEYTYML